MQLLCASLSRVNSKLPEKESNLSWFWLGDLQFFTYILHLYFQFFHIILHLYFKTYNPAKVRYKLLLKAGRFCSICKYFLFYCWFVVRAYLIVFWYFYIVIHSWDRVMSILRAMIYAFKKGIATNSNTFCTKNPGWFQYYH